MARWEGITAKIDLPLKNDDTPNNLRGNEFAGPYARLIMICMPPSTSFLREVAAFINHSCKQWSTQYVRADDRSSFPSADLERVMPPFHVSEAQLFVFHSASSEGNLQAERKWTMEWKTGIYYYQTVRAGRNSSYRSILSCSKSINGTASGHKLPRWRSWGSIASVPFLCFGLDLLGCASLDRDASRTARSTCLHFTRDLAATCPPVSGRQRITWEEVDGGPPRACGTV